MLTKSDTAWLKSELVPALADEVEHRLKKKLDDVSIKLDKFVGEIQKRRQEQTLHQGQHRRINDRLDKIEKRLNFS